MLYINKNQMISNEEWNRIFNEMGLLPKLQSARSIIVKPNFAAGTYVDPKTHVISDIGLLKSIIEYMSTVNSEAVINIAEADSTGYGFAYLKFVHLKLPGSLGLSKRAENRVNLLDLSRDHLRKCNSPLFKRYVSVDRQLWLSETLLDADLIVNLSNLKTHSVTGYTGACKNLFGCLPDAEKYHNHPYIHYVIHDLALAIHPHLNIVDAFYGMEKNGPVQGVDVNSGYRVISDSPIEADIYASSTIGLNPKSIKYIRLLMGSCDIGIDEVPVVMKKYKKPALFLRMMNSVGLFIQRVGLSVEAFGHRIHGCPTPLILAITIFRPLALKLFDYEQLKAWKRKIIK